MSILIQDSNSTNADKLIIVDTRVQEKDVFLNSIKTNVYAIILDFENDTYDSILTKIQNNMIHDTLESIALVSHGQYDDNYSFLEKENSPKLRNISLEDPNFDSWKEFLDFLIKLKALTSIKYLDLLGCAIVSYDEWKLILNYLETNSGINIRASIDNTGNLVAGGNWILETDNNIDINAKELYFTDEILNFTGLLANSNINFDISTNLVLTNNGRAWSNYYIGGITSSVFRTFALTINSNYIYPRYNSGLLRFSIGDIDNDGRVFYCNLGSLKSYTSHTIYFWLYRTSTSTEKVEVIWISNTSAPDRNSTLNTILTINASTNPVTQNGWYRYSASFTNTNTSGNYYFGLRLSKGNVYLDEIQILEGKITTHPANQIISTSNTFNVSVSDISDTPTYQWESSYDDIIYTTISNASTNSYTITTQTNNPIIYYRCLINGYTYSNSAYLLNPNFLLPNITVSNQILKILPEINYVQRLDSSNNIILEPRPGVSNIIWTDLSNNTLSSGTVNYTPTSYNKYIKYTGTINLSSTNTYTYTSNTTLFNDTNFNVDISGTQFKFSQNGIDYINPKLGLDYHVKYTFNLNYIPNTNTLLRFYDISSIEYIQTNTPSGMIKYFDINNADITNDISNNMTNNTNISKIKKIEFTNKILYKSNPSIIASDTFKSSTDYQTQINYKSNSSTTGNSIIFPTPPRYIISGDTSALNQEMYKMSILGENNTSIDFTSNTIQRSGIGLKNATTHYVELFQNRNYSMTITPSTENVSANTTSDRYKLYIDYNGDGDFIDISETVFDNNNSTDISLAKTYSFTIPSNLPITNNLLRLRIILNTSTNISTYPNGSTYDFSARILQPFTIYTQPLNIIKTDDSINTTSFDISSNDTSYQWQISTDNSTFANIVGATSNSYTQTNITNYITYYRCILDGYYPSDKVYLLATYLLLPDITFKLKTLSAVISDISDISGIQWQTFDNSWNDISNATLTNYTPTAYNKYIRYSFTYNSTTYTSNSTRIINNTVFDVDISGTKYKFSQSGIDYLNPSLELDYHIKYTFNLKYTIYTVNNLLRFYDSLNNEYTQSNTPSGMIKYFNSSNIETTISNISDIKKIEFTNKILYKNNPLVIASSSSDSSISNYLTKINYRNNSNTITGNSIIFPPLPTYPYSAEIYTQWGELSSMMIIGEYDTSINFTSDISEQRNVIGLKNATTQYVELFPDQSYSMTITSGPDLITTVNTSYIWKLFIDYNGDGNFIDTNEVIFNNTIRSDPNNVTSTYNFTIPLSVSVSNNLLRMRLIFIFNNLYIYGSSDANGTYQNGSTYDFSARIIQKNTISAQLILDRSNYLTQINYSSNDTTIGNTIIFPSLPIYPFSSASIISDREIYAMSIIGANNTSINFTSSNIQRSNIGLKNATEQYVELYPNISYSMTVTPGTIAGTEYYKLFIDYNCDGDFLDISEIVFNNYNSNSTANLQKTYNFTIPSSITITNNLLRMRLIEMSSSIIVDASGSYDYGSTYDFSARIIQSPTISTQPTSIIKTSTSNTPFTISSNAISYQWQISTDSINFTDIIGIRTTSSSYTPTDITNYITYYRCKLNNGDLYSISVYLLATYLLSPYTTITDLSGISGIQWQTSYNNITWINIPGPTFYNKYIRYTFTYISTTYESNSTKIRGNIFYIVDISGTQFKFSQNGINGINYINPSFTFDYHIKYTFNLASSYIVDSNNLLRFYDISNNEYTQANTPLGMIKYFDSSGKETTNIPDIKKIEFTNKILYKNNPLIIASSPTASTSNYLTQINYKGTSITGNSIIFPTLPIYPYSSETDSSYEELTKMMIQGENNTLINFTSDISGQRNITGLKNATTEYIELYANKSYSMDVTSGTGNDRDYSIYKLFIDYNNDGNFLDASEVVFNNTISSNTNNTDYFKSTYAFTIPSSIPITNNLLRMRLIYVFNDTTSNANNTYTWGSTYDFSARLIERPPVISTLPRDIIKTSSNDNKAFDISSNATLYQWQSSTDNINFIDISGASTFTYIPITSVLITYYRCILNGSYPSNSVYLLATYLLLPDVTIGLKTLSTISDISDISGIQWQTLDNSWNNISGATLTNYTPTEYNKYIRYSFTYKGIGPYTSNSTLILNTIFDVDILGTQFKFTQNGIDFGIPKLELDYHVKYTFNLKYTVTESNLLRFYDISNNEYIQSKIPSGMIKYFDISGISDIDITNDVSNNSTNIPYIKKIEFTNKILYNKNLSITANSASALLSPLIIADTDSQSRSNYLTQINYKGTSISGNSIIFQPLPTYPYSGEHYTDFTELFGMDISGANNTRINFTSDNAQRLTTGLKNATEHYVELYPNGTYSMTINAGNIGGNSGNMYKLFIDYNGNGYFTDPSEVAITTLAAIYPGNYTHTFTIPQTVAVTTNLLRMRIVNISILMDEYVNSSGTCVFGSTYDFSARIIQPPTIYTQPLNIIKTSNSSSTQFDISSNATSRQWQISTDNINFTDIYGATLNTYTPINSSLTYYRCKLNGSYPSNSVYLLATYLLFPDVTIGLQKLSAISGLTDISGIQWLTSDTSNNPTNIYGAISTNYTPTEFNKYISYSFTYNTATYRSNSTLILNTIFDVDISGTQFKFSQNGIDYGIPKLGLDYHVKYTFNLNYTVTESNLLRFYDITNNEYIQSKIPSGMIKYFNNTNLDITNDVSSNSVNIPYIKKIEFTNKILYNKNLDITENFASTLLSPLIIANSSAPSTTNYLTQINYKGTSITGNSIIFQPLPTYPYSGETNNIDPELFGMDISGANNTRINFTSDNAQRLTTGLKNATEHYVELYPNVPYSMTINAGTMGGNWDNMYKLFIDYNGDGNFTDPYEVAITTLATIMPAIYTHTFTIPQTVTVTTNLLRMRIVYMEIFYGNYVNSDSTYDYGSTYDFSARIIPTPTIGTQLSNITNSVSSGNTSSFTVPSNWNATSYQWQVSTNNLTFNDINEAILSSYMPTDTRYITFYRCKLNNGYLYSNTVYLLNSHISLLPSPKILIGSILNVNSNILNISGSSIQWQSNEANITGVNSDTYMPSTLTRIRYQITYPLNGSTEIITSNITDIILPTISVQPTNMKRTSSTNNFFSTISNDVPVSNFDISSNATSWQWEISTDNSTFNDISDAINSQYIPNNTNNYITFYRCKLNGYLYSNTVYLLNSHISLLPSPTTLIGSILNVNSNILNISGSSIQWQSEEVDISGAISDTYMTSTLTRIRYQITYPLNGSTETITSNSTEIILSTNWAPITNAINSSYTPTDLTYPYIRYKITYTLNGINTNIISNSTQIIVSLNINIQPQNIIKTLSSSSPQFDISSNATLYQWQVSTDDISFTNIPGAQTSSYTPTNITNYITYYKCKLNNGDLYSNSVYLLATYLLLPTTVYAGDQLQTKSGMTGIKWQSSPDTTMWTYTNDTSTNYIPTDLINKYIKYEFSYNGTTYNYPNYTIVMKKSLFKIELDSATIKQPPVSIYDATNKTYVDSEITRLLDGANNSFDTLSKISLVINNNPDTIKDISESIYTEYINLISDISDISNSLYEAKRDISLNLFNVHDRAIIAENAIIEDISTTIIDRIRLVTDLSNNKFPKSADNNYTVDLSGNFTINAYLKIGSRWRIKCNSGGNDDQYLIFEYLVNPSDYTSWYQFTEFRFS